jgi:hypothetical protein
MPEEKELWQMTDREYIRWKRENLTDEQKKRWKEKTDRAVVIKDRVIEQWREEHVEIVHRALSDGEPVPENVLAQYPLLLETVGLRSEAAVLLEDAEVTDEAPAPFECAAVTDGDGKLFDRYGAGRYSCRLPSGVTGLGTTPLEALREARRKERQGPTQELLEAAVYIMGIIDHRDGLRYRQDLITEDERDHLRKAIARFD